MHIPEPLKQQILTHCQTAEPNEACGFVILDYQQNQPQFLPCENVAVDPENYFEIDADDFVRAEMQGEMVAVVHSHPHSATDRGEMKLSIADRQMQDLLQLDFWLVCDGDLQIFPRSPPLWVGSLVMVLRIVLRFSVTFIFWLGQISLTLNA